MADKPQTTPEDQPMMMRLGTHGWRNLATVEDRERLREQREQMRQKAKETL